MYSNIGPLDVYGDSKSVEHNTSRPKLVLRKKSNSLCKHTIQVSVAMGESPVRHIPSKENVVDLMMKVLYGQKRKYLVIYILYGIHDKYPIGNRIKLEGTRKMCQ